LGQELFIKLFLQVPISAYKCFVCIPNLPGFIYSYRSLKMLLVGGDVLAKGVASYRIIGVGLVAIIVLAFLVVGCASDGTPIDTQGETPTASPTATSDTSQTRPPQTSGGSVETPTPSPTATPPSPTVATTGTPMAVTPSPTIDDATPLSPTPTQVEADTPTPTPSSVPTERPPMGNRIGNSAPNFEVTTIDGERLTLTDFQGRPVILYFFATW
jgi:hypothetical protein